MTQILTPQRLRELVDYDSITGAFTWKARPKEDFQDSVGQSAAHRWGIWNAKNAGKPALAVRGGNGYLIGTVLNLKIYAHRAAWAHHYGTWPVNHVDHVNGDRLDNRISNLRDVTRWQNLHNRPAQRNSQSGVKGVSWDKARGRWYAQIRVNGVNHRLGHFEDIAQAKAAYDRASHAMVWGGA